MITILSLCKHWVLLKGLKVGIESSPIGMKGGVDNLGGWGTSFKSSFTIQSCDWEQVKTFHFEVFFLHKFVETFQVYHWSVAPIVLFHKEYL